MQHSFFPFTTNLTLFLTKTKSSKAGSLHKDQCSSTTPTEGPRSLQSPGSEGCAGSGWVDGRGQTTVTRTVHRHHGPFPFPGGGRASRTMVHTCPDLTPTKAYEVGRTGPLSLHKRSGLQSSQKPTSTLTSSYPFHPQSQTWSCSSHRSHFTVC